MTTPALLEARGACCVLPSEHGGQVVFDDLSLAVAPGEVVDIIGPSGSGKSTLLRFLARLLPDSRGELFFRGTPARDIPAIEWRTQVTLLPQKPAIVPGTVRDNILAPWTLRVRSGQAPPSDASLRAALDAVMLDDVPLDRDAFRMSVGQQARVAFARVRLTRPTVLLLDEADAALDDDSTRALSDAVVRFNTEDADRGTAVIRVRHRQGDGVGTRRLRLAKGVLSEEVCS